MSNLKQIKQRIKATQSTVKVTKTVQLIAASKFRVAKDRSLLSDEFFIKVTNVLSSFSPFIVKALSNKNKKDEKLGRLFMKLFEKRSSASDNSLFIVAIGSNKGLCGSLNSSVAKMINNIVAGKMTQNMQHEIKICCFGKNLMSLLKPSKQMGAEIIDYSELYNDKMDIIGMASFFSDVMDLWSESKSKDILFCYNKFISTLVQEATSLSLRESISKDRFIKNFLELQDDSAISFTGIEPIVDGSYKYVFEQVLKQFFSALFYRAVKNSFASEYAMKMRSMESATKNGDKLLNELKLDYNKIRKNNITREIIDMSGGINAVQDV